MSSYHCIYIHILIYAKNMALSLEQKVWSTLDPPLLGGQTMMQASPAPPKKTCEEVNPITVNNAQLDPNQAYLNLKRRYSGFKGALHGC